MDLMGNKNIMVIAMTAVAMLSFLFGNMGFGNVEETMAISIQENTPITNTIGNIAINKQDNPTSNIEYDMEDQFKIQPLTQEIKEKIKNVSWTDKAPYPINDLRHVKVMHWGFDDEVHEGELIVHKMLAEEVVVIFKDLLDAKFPIEKIRLIDEYNAIDKDSMEDNNTSALCVRKITNKESELSRHTFGIAIDINPVQNPYVKDGIALPKNGSEYIDRTEQREGMIIEGDVCYNAFIMRGWTWGGHWKTIKDYQHFHKDIEINLTTSPEITERQFEKLWIEAVKSLKKIGNPKGESIEIQGKVYQAYPDHLNKKEKIGPYLRNYFTQDYVKTIIEALDMVGIEDALYCPDKKMFYDWVDDDLIDIQMLDSNEKIKIFKVNLNHQEITVKTKHVGSQGWRIQSIKP